MTSASKPAGCCEEMALTRFDDETLMAFVDGALGEPEFSAIAAALETDPDLAARVDALSRGADLARLAFGEPEPVPDALRDAVDAAIARHEGTNVAPFLARRRSGWLPMLAAASLAALVAGPLGYFLNAGDAPVDRLVIGSAVTPELSRLLDNVASGETGTLGAGLTLRPIATFDAAGEICREFALDGEAGATAIACRDERDWQVAVAVATPSDPGYRPASAPAAIEAWLVAMEAGEPFSPAAERDALAAPTRR